jgi:hypothetical protein
MNIFCRDSGYVKRNSGSERSRTSEDRCQYDIQPLRRDITTSPIPSAIIPAKGLKPGDFVGVGDIVGICVSTGREVIAGAEDGTANG